MARLVIEVHVLDIVVLVRVDDQNEARRRKQTLTQQTLTLTCETVQNCVLIQIHFRFIAYGKFLPFQNGYDATCKYILEEEHKNTRQHYSNQVLLKYLLTAQPFRGFSSFVQASAAPSVWKTSDDRRPSK